MKTNLRPHIYLFIVNAFYGAGFSVSKMVMPQFIKPFGFIMIRVTFATALFFTLHYFSVKEKIERADVGRLILCGLFGIVINQELFFLGLSITRPINASLIMIMTPILVYLISFFLGHEKVTPQKVAGIALGSAGALVILGGRGFNFNSSTILGDMCILINAASYAVYLVIVRPLMHKYHPFTVIKWVFFTGLLPVIIFGWQQLAQVEWSSFTPAIWLAVAFIVVCVTFLAYLLNILALRQLHSSVVGAYIYLQPVLATVISIALGKDKLSAEKIVSAILIFAGVYLVSFAGKGKLPEDELIVQE
jgi:drug/metabolite transporter (DMT)-like permease